MVVSFGFEFSRIIEGLVFLGVLFFVDFRFIISNFIVKFLEKIKVKKINRRDEVIVVIKVDIGKKSIRYFGYLKIWV